MNFENTNHLATAIAPMFFAAFRAISNRDYRGQSLPSIFGAEAKSFHEVEYARKWLVSIKHGGKIERWDDQSKLYEALETVEASK